MRQRLALIGFVIASIIAVAAVVLRQQALDTAQTAQAFASAEARERSTSEAILRDSVATQVQAEANLATAAVAAEQSAADQAQAEAAQETAAAQAAAAETQSAVLVATATAAAAEAGAQAEAAAAAQATLAAEATAEAATAQAQIDAGATALAESNAALGTATAQIALAEFAQEAAEQDRQNALTQAWTAATALAEVSDQLATATAILSGVTATFTPLPATPTPTPAAELEPTTVTSELGETFRSNDGSTRFDYPSGWIVEELNNGVILIVNREEVFNVDPNDLTAGMFSMSLVVTTVEAMGAPAGTTAASFLPALVDFIAGQDPPGDMGAVAEIEIGGLPAARSLGTQGGNDLALVIVDLDDGVLAVSIATSDEGEMDQFLDAMDAIMASVQYNP